MNGDPSPLDRYLDAWNKTHSCLRGRLPGDGQTAEVVVIGQCPEVDTVPRSPARHLLWRQQTVGNGRMAVEVEVGWGHGQQKKIIVKSNMKLTIAQIRLCGAADDAAGCLTPGIRL